MSFEVTSFQAPTQPSLLWQFTINNPNHSRLDFHAQEQSSRSLELLAIDISAQIQQHLTQNKHAPKERILRKVTEKLLKALDINVDSFALDIGEETASVLAFFKKCKLEEEVKKRVAEKCKKWVLQMWLSLSPQLFYQSTQKYLSSYVRDGKRQTTDFQLLNELYVITMGDSFKEQEEGSQSGQSQLLLIEVSINVDDKYVSESCLWDSEQLSNLRIKAFAVHFLHDLLQVNGIQVQKDEMQELQRDVFNQIRAQIVYKSLLKKCSGMLLNFSSMDIPTELKEYNAPIQLKLEDSKSGKLLFEDKFEWDILNQHNNVEEFVEGLMADQNLPEEYHSELCYSIRSQIASEVEWKLDLLVKTFKSIHKDRETPKLNTQTISVLRRNVNFSMDVSMPPPNHNYTPHRIYFNNSDLFSLLSRHLDVLPDQFQQILLGKQAKEGKEKQEKTGRVDRGQAQEVLLKERIGLESNEYIPSWCQNSNLHTIWRNSLNK